MSDNTSINSFLGLNMNETGDTQLKLGESGKMVNFRITKDNKLDKMYGYKEVFKQDGIIRAQWKGKLGENIVHVYVCGGKVYNGNIEIGELSDNTTTIFEFNKKLYFLNSHEYKSWDAETFGDVEGYIPLIRISTKPNEEGKSYEPINMLTGKKHQTFSATGDDNVFYLAEQNLTSIDKVLVSGIEATVTKDLVNGKVTFATAPAQGTDNIDIYWTKGTGEREKVYKNLYATLYGLADDTRVFLYGNEEAKNRIIFSALANGVSSVEYFCGTDFIDVGSSNKAVTDISRQYDRIIISKEDSTYYGQYETIMDSTGASIITFPVSPLNTAHGMIAPAQSQVLDNYVTTIDTSIVQWTSTNTKDERNAEIISTKIQEWLNKHDLTKSITLDYQEEKEYWLAIENEIMVYNYQNGCFYLLNIPSKITSLISYQGIIYMSTENGEIMEFDKNLTTYNGEGISAEWQSGYYDFGIEERRKTMRILWVTLKPHSKTSLVVNYVSDRDAGSDEKEIENRCIDYRYWNYDNFTYNTQRSVKPFRIKLKAKKFAFLKLILKNEKSDEKVTVNSIAIKKVYGGEVK